jgi:undecaprenyl-diphosphatase
LQGQILGWTAQAGIKTVKDKTTFQLRELAEGGWAKVRAAVATERARRYRTWLFQGYIIAVLIAFSILALTANLVAYLQVDLTVTRELQSDLPHWVRWVMIAISWPGYVVQSISIVLLTVVILSVLGLRWEAVSALFAALNSGIINYLVKVVVRRPRPTSDLVDVFSQLNSYSFPSGHVMFYVGFFGFLLFLTFILFKRTIKRRIGIILLALLILGVGISRMYLGEHWASDVIGGYLLGSLCLILSIQFYRWGKDRFSHDQAVAPESKVEKE